MMQGVLNDIPKWLTNGLSAMGACLPAVGFAIIANLISKPKFVPFFFAGFFLIQYTKIGTIPLLLVGAFLTFLYLTFTAKDYTASADADEEEDEDEDEEDEVEAAGLRQRLLSKGEVLKSWTLWWIFAEVGHSFERMQAPMFCTAMTPALKKFYKGNKERYIEALKRHMIFFNSEAHWGGGPCLGLSLAMEEKKSQAYDEIPGEMIVNLKTGLMGPLAGIGDTLFWTLLPTIMGSIAGYMALEGNPIGVILWLIVNLIFICIRTQLMWIGYREGTKLITKVGSKLARITDAASVLGLTVVGALSATVVTAKTPLAFQMGEVNLAVADLLDKIMPSMISVATVLVLYKLLGKKGMKITTLILIVIIFSMICSALGILA